MNGFRLNFFEGWGTGVCPRSNRLDYGGDADWDVYPGFRQNFFYCPAPLISLSLTGISSLKSDRSFILILSYVIIRASLN